MANQTMVANSHTTNSRTIHPDDVETDTALFGA